MIYYCFSSHYKLIRWFNLLQGWQFLQFYGILLYICISNGCHYCHGSWIDWGRVLVSSNLFYKLNLYVSYTNVPWKKFDTWKALFVFEFSSLSSASSNPGSVKIYFVVYQNNESWPSHCFTSIMSVTIKNYLFVISIIFNTNIFKLFNLDRVCSHSPWLADLYNVFLNQCVSFLIIKSLVFVFYLIDII